MWVWFFVIAAGTGCGVILGGGVVLFLYRNNLGVLDLLAGLFLLVLATGAVLLVVSLVYTLMGRAIPLPGTKAITAWLRWAYHRLGFLPG